MKRKCPICLRTLHATAFAKKSSALRKHRLCKRCFDAPKHNPWYVLKKRKNAAVPLPLLMADSRNAVSNVPFKVIKLTKTNYVREERCPSKQLT